MGLFHLVPGDINQYIDKVAKKVAFCKHHRLSYIKGREYISAKVISKLEKMQTFCPQQIIVIGDIQVIPYFVNPSATGNPTIISVLIYNGTPLLLGLMKDTKNLLLFI